MNNLSAKKSVIMKLIEAMDDEMSDKLKPESMDIEVMKLEGKPKMHKMSDGEMMKDEDMEDDDYDKEDSDIKSFLDSPEMDGEDEDMSILDRFKKKYQKGD